MWSLKSGCETISEELHRDAPAARSCTEGKMGASGTVGGMRFCVSPGCSEVIEGRRLAYCPAHEPSRPAWAGSSSEAGTSRARAMRRKVLARDRYRCVRCGQKATDVDAIVPSARGGSHTTMANLQSLCESCHALKTEYDRREGVRKGGR